MALLELNSISTFHFKLAQYCKEEMETNLTAAELDMCPNYNWKITGVLVLKYKLFWGTSEEEEVELQR